ncbi:unnamed protein product, partial [Darwinula stevensoni]
LAVLTTSTLPRWGGEILSDHLKTEARAARHLDLVHPNAHLESKGYPVPKATKTGTTICGTVFKDGVILGADSRATSDNIVAEKECQKIYYLVPNITCGAGTAADMEKVAELISSQLELHRLNTGRSVPVVAACRMIKQRLFNYQGYIGAALIVGGVDSTGPHLFEIHPHGSSQTGMFCTMGSGSLACMSVLESRWKENMNLDEAKQMVRDAIKAGITNDLGSGSNVDMCVITKDKVDFIRPYEVVCAKGVSFLKKNSLTVTPSWIPTEVIPSAEQKELDALVSKCQRNEEASRKLCRDLKKYCDTMSSLGKAEVAMTGDLSSSSMCQNDPQLCHLVEGYHALAQQVGQPRCCRAEP